MTSFLLSHHYPQEYNHCILFKFKQKNYYLCARCFGYYSSFFIFFLFYFFVDSFIYNFNWIILYFLPFFAFIDWELTEKKIYSGNNSIRYITGFLLGITGSRLIFLFLHNPFEKSIYLCFGMYFILIMILFFFNKNTS